MFSVDVCEDKENRGAGQEITEKIHARSKRSGKPFIPVDCELLSKELAVSELFGYERGRSGEPKARSRAFGRKPSEARCSLTR